MYRLRNYQEKTLEIIDELEPGDRGLFALPTASGKTVIFATLAARIDGRTLIVVPSSELRVQSIEKLKNVNPELDVGSVQARLDEVDSKIVVATRQSLTHAKSNRIERMIDRGDFEVVIFDECHQAIDQIVKIVNRINDNVKILGFTATPYNYDMPKVFSEVTYQRTLFEMIEEGFLCEPKALLVSSTTSLLGVKTQLGDFNQRELELTVNNDERNELIVKAYLKYASDRKSTIIFCSGIDHCIEVAKEFNKYGIYCKSIDSKLDTHNRDEIITEFKSSSLPVICNVGILSTGFDHEATDCIILARPTKSRILYEQIIGRGLRLWEGKKDCLIIDIVDVTKYHDLMSLTDVFGVEIKSGETVREAFENRKREAVEIQREKEERDRKRQEELKLIAEQVELFNRDMNNRFKEAYCDFFRCDATTYTLSINSSEHYAISKNSDVFEIYYVSTAKGNKYAELLEDTANLLDAINLVENTYITKKNSFTYRDSSGFSWKKDPATPNQLKYVPNKYNLKTKWDVHRYFNYKSIVWQIKKYRKNSK